ncbi:hypothetical protein M3196_13175 [Fictibacillus nanhaiensis]|uniref:hypothetical protein n=1 Tax=Fictibacillus nanhaiensis TaxID=742169 RepID=UPI002041485D|nr:hypothetical protein [Fictibacillus nanhaiensis]MCM3732618.1 hypothetical protein [Fictibacillus nanhaiensis]
MNKKLSLIVFSILIVFAAVYLLYYSKPAELPAKDELLQKINSTLLNIGATKVQDTIYVDDTHVFVPFITKNNKYGKSFWTWNKYKWEVTSIQSGGQPSIWKIDKENPNSYKIVWNIHPDDKLDSMNLYLMRERNYHITGDIHVYQPGVQMVQKINITNRLFGSMDLPKNWANFLDSILRVELDKPFINTFELEQAMYFGWNNGKKYDENTYPKLSQNASGIQNDDLSYVRYMDDNDLESQ